MRTRILLLLVPLLLLLASGVLLGTYFETNDDLTIVALLRGETAAAPVADLYLYFHGYAALWSQLYTVWPLVPWYGLTLYALLYAATVLGAAVLWPLLRPHGSPALVFGVLLLLWLVAWLEHGFWFNYVRVPVLLAGTGLLFAAQRAPARWALAIGLLAFGLSWLIRPSAALLGALAVVPGAWWLAGRRVSGLLLGVGLLAAGGALALNLSWTPAAATFRRLDVFKSNLNDFGWAAPPAYPLSASDSLTLAATRHWLLADSTLVNEAALRRVAPFEAAYFVRHTAPHKLAQLLRQFPRDYFPLLLLLAATGLMALRARPGRPLFWLAQVGYLALVLALGVGLKLPPRLALPLLDCWVLSNLMFVLRPAVAFRGSPAWLLLALGLAAGPYCYKTAHRRSVLAQERRQQRIVRQQLMARARQQLPASGGVVVSDALEETYKGESPFAVGPVRLPANMRWLSVRGWQTLHPSQPAWRRQLTGTADFPTALHRLGTRPGVVWLLTPATAQLLNRRLQLQRRPGEPAIGLRPITGGLPEQAQAYQMRIKFPQ